MCYRPSSPLVRHTLTLQFVLFLAIVQLMPLCMYAQRPTSESHLVSLNNDWETDKYSMFIHYGLYSLAAGVWDSIPIKRGYSEQIRAFAPLASAAEYDALATQFDPFAWHADSIVALAEAAGMRSIVFTAKHHDGFCMYRTATTPYNVVDATPSKRDILGELADACQRRGMKLGIYFSLIDWHYPQALPMSGHNADSIPPAHHEYNKAQIRELLTQYGSVSELWFDMGSLRPEQSRELYHLVHNLQPACRVSGRLGNGQYDFAVMADNELPDEALVVPWQTAASFYHETWGYRVWQQRVSDDLLFKDKVRELVQVVSRGGNYLLNIGPKGDGSVVDQEIRVLHRMGQWLQRYGETIYNTRGASRYLSSELREIEATRTDSILYLFFSAESIDRLKSAIDLDSLIIADGIYISQETLSACDSMSVDLNLNRQPISITTLDGRNISYDRKPKNQGIRIPFKSLRSWAATTDSTAYWHVLRLSFDRPFVLRPSYIQPSDGKLTACNAEPQYGHYQWDYYTGHKTIVGYSWYTTLLPRTLTYLDTDTGATRWISYNDGPLQEFSLQGGKALSHRTDFAALTITHPTASRLRGTFGSLRQITGIKSERFTSAISNDKPQVNLLQGEQAIEIDRIYTDSVGPISGVCLVQNIYAQRNMMLPVCLTFTNGIDVVLNNRRLTTQLTNRDHSSEPMSQTILLPLSKGSNLLVVRYFNRFADRCTYGISFPKVYTTRTIPLPLPVRKIRPSGGAISTSLWESKPPHTVPVVHSPSIELR